MMSKACESKITDQSIFNIVFRAHALVSGSYNDNRYFDITGTSHIVHFVGEPKPWQEIGKHSRVAKPHRFNASRLWQSRCKAVYEAYRSNPRPLAPTTTKSMLNHTHASNLL
tara:strand:- start:180 stop:515 length:336 start_codon:yes stop_codon:yes gene_type:complete